ncbi:MAG: DUF5989 family protein [Anaerolineales bacterium]
MTNWLRSFAANAGVVGQIFKYLWKNKMWWLIPMVTVLVVFGLLLVFTSASGLGPFIYTLF